MESNYPSVEIPEPPSLQDRLNIVRSFSRDANLSFVRSLLDTGVLLVRTAQRLDPGTDAHANCLEAARKCSQGAERDLWKLRYNPDAFVTLASDIERLECEIAALSPS
ncbi:MAG TPA: hypothetical protein VGR78_13795 [Verrucomicrobiae bacterium]|jgi:hypothetical protein|nr:hypothetical protein [Verrucomicrobiae bacterium]HEX3117935.1 hypothetical protein [Candidatus Acidoferrum sp.]